MREEGTMRYRRHIQILFAIFPTFIATLIYIIFRDDNIYLVSIYYQAEPLSQIRNFLDTCGLIKIHFPKWIIYSLPDGLWSITCYSLVAIFMGKHITLPYYFILFVLIISLEIGQLFHFINGTYDFTDVIMYIISFFLYFIISYHHKLINIKCLYKNRKINHC